MGQRNDARQYDRDFDNRRGHQSERDMPPSPWGASENNAADSESEPAAEGWGNSDVSEGGWGAGPSERGGGEWGESDVQESAWGDNGTPEVREPAPRLNRRERGASRDQGHPGSAQQGSWGQGEANGGQWEDSNGQSEAPSSGWGEPEATETIWGEGNAQPEPPKANRSRANRQPERESGGWGEPETTVTTSSGWGETDQSEAPHYSGGSRQPMREPDGWGATEAPANVWGEVDVSANRKPQRPAPAATFSPDRRYA
jgi:hypothetical protein